MSTFSCLFVGRFQPFHRGHLLVVKGMTKVAGKVVIAIGSSDGPKTAENPFTAAERREMIQRALQDEDIIPNFDVTIVEVPDMADDAEWTKKCLEMSEVPPSGVIPPDGGKIHQAWTGNEATKKCFEDAGVEVKVIKEVPGISATEVRARLKLGGDWRALVPSEVASYLSEIEAPSRIKSL